MIKLINVRKNFNSRVLFRDISIQIPLNQITFIIGDSGSGKTTLLNMIGGIEKTNSGKIVLHSNNREIDLQKNKYFNLIDFVFQDFNLFSDLNVLNNLKIGKKVLGKQWSKNQTINELNDVGLSRNILKAKSLELSSGEQQRIALLRSLQRDSKILLIDEPTGNLDEENAKKVFEILKNISKNKTVVVVTHDSESSYIYADNIFKIENSSVLCVKSSNQKPNSTLIIKKEKPQKYILNKLSIFSIMTVNDFKKRKITFFLVFITILLLLISNLFTFLFYARVFDINNNKLSANNFDVAIVSKKPIFTQKERINESISENDNKKLKNDKNIKAIYDVNVNLINPQFFYNGRFINSKNGKMPKFEEIENNNYFINRFKNSGLKGDIVNDNNQIIIGKSFADAIDEPNLIGKNITLISNIDGIPPKVLKIVNINNNETYNGDYINYIYKDFWKQPRIRKENVFFKPKYYLHGNFEKDRKIIEQPLPKLIDGTEKMTLGTNVKTLNSLLISTELVNLWRINKFNVSLGTDFSLKYYSDLGKNLKVTGIFIFFHYCKN